MLAVLLLLAVLAAMTLLWWWSPRPLMHGPRGGGSPRRILIVSSGGVATTHVMTVIRQRVAAGALPPITMNDLADNDDLKHARRSVAYQRRLLHGECEAGGEWRRCPRHFVGLPDAVVLLFAHPTLATASIFRRRLARRMWAAFHSSGGGGDSDGLAIEPP